MSSIWEAVELDGPVHPDRALELAQEAVRLAARSHQVELDYSPESLLAVDEIVESLRGASLAEPPAAALLCLGCYAGEGLARRLGGSWVSIEDSSMAGLGVAPLVLSMGPGASLNPIGKVHKCFEHGEGDSVFALYHAVAHMPPFGG